MAADIDVKKEDDIAVAAGIADKAGHAIKIGDTVTIRAFVTHMEVGYTTRVRVETEDPIPGDEKKTVLDVFAGQVTVVRPLAATPAVPKQHPMEIPRPGHEGVPTVPQIPRGPSPVLTESPSRHPDYNNPPDHTGGTTPTGPQAPSEVSSPPAETPPQQPGQTGGSGSNPQPPKKPGSLPPPTGKPGR